MINMRDIYDTWSLDQQSDYRSYLIDSIQMASFLSYSGFDYSTAGICNSFSSLKNELYIYKQYKSDSLEPELAMNVAAIGDYCCEILDFTRYLNENDKIYCIRKIAVNSINILSKFVLDYHKISKYCYNVQVSYEILKGFVDELLKICDPEIYYDIIETVSVAILNINDKIESLGDEIVSPINDSRYAELFDFRSFLIDIRNRLL